MRMPPVLFDYFSLTGGLNLVSPPLSIAPGSAIDALNFEVGIDGGYTRVAGYERYSGQPEPSACVYVFLPMTFSASVAVGATITGAVSGATAAVIAVSDEGLFTTKLSDSFSVAEVIRVAGSPVGTLDSTPLINGGTTSPKEDAAMLALAANVYREDIGPVPGSGPVRGVYYFNGVEYAFRDSEDGLQGRMYKSSSTGWQAVPLGTRVRFTNANTSVQEGDTLTQGGATALIIRVVLEEGSLASGTNVGQLIISPIAGSFTAGAATSTGGGTLTLAGPATAITLPPGGKYEFASYNFKGFGYSRRMYGVNGVGPAFEFDGSVFVSIRSGLADDKPSYISAHANYLFLGYKSSAIYSGIGEPYMWTSVAGAGEVAIGDFLTGFLSMTGSDGSPALAVFCNNRTSVIYGSSAANFQAVNLSLEAGGRPRTMKTIGDSFVFDSLGVRKIAATQNFGNFTQAQITNPVRPFVLFRRSKAIGSCISRHKDQYRIFFDDGFALHITMSNSNVAGIMPVRHAHTFACVESAETDLGDEFILAGGTDGYVYRFEKGTSFDGDPISAYLNLAFAYQKGPRIKKKFRKAAWEFSGQGYAELEMSYSLAYASDEIANPVSEYIDSPSRPVFWDSFVWDSFFWDGRSLAPMIQQLGGSGENISLILRCTSDAYPSFTVHSSTIHYTPRRALR